MSHRSLGCALLLMAAAAFGCGEDVVTKRSVDVTRADVKAAVSSNNQLATALVRAFRDEPGNVFYSPLSIEAVLGMLYGGAHGDTASQLGALLGAAEEQQLLHRGLGLLIDDVGGDHGYTLDLANSLFVDDGLSVLPDYEALLRTAYRAPQQRLDYSHPEAARAAINDWVSQHTQSEIPELLKAGELDQSSLLYVVNALYFKAEWRHGFDSAKTRDGEFQRADGSRVSVPMMQLDKTVLREAFTPAGTLLELPYRNGELSFLAFLPEDRYGVGAFEELLASAQLPELVSKLHDTSCTVTLPRFELRMRYDLIPALEALGVEDLFQRGVADLSGIDGTRDLFVNVFLQEAMIRVDERGTVAVASTTAGQLRSSPHPFVFDHPFGFFIYDNRTGSILFTGRVLDPS